MDDKNFNIYDIVKKLTGGIDPVGSSHFDEKIFENLVELCDLVDKLTDDIIKVSTLKLNHQYSVKKAGVYADCFVKILRSNIENTLD